MAEDALCAAKFNRWQAQQITKIMQKVSEKFRKADSSYDACTCVTLLLHLQLFLALRKKYYV